MQTLHYNEATARDPSIPPGFTILSSGGDEIHIHHTRGGMGCLNIFLIVWLAGWTAACAFLLHQYLHDGKMDDGTPMPLWFPSIFWAGEVFVACLLIYLLFCKKSFRTDVAHLTVETDVLGFRRRKTIPRNAIQRFLQVKDGGVGDDSFPSWGLKVEADKKTTLLFRQPYEKSLWLGRVLAKWANVDFIETTKE
jgi:hypothetical protein